MRWPSEDVLSQFFAHYWLWRFRPEEDRIKEFEHVLGAYDALRQLNDSPLCYGFDDAVVLLWYPVNPSRNVPPEAIPLFLDVVDTYLEMSDSDGWLPEPDDYNSLSYAGELVSRAGYLLLESDPRGAKLYFERARGFEDELVECDDYHPAEEGDIDNPRSWRVVLARGLRDIYLNDLDVEKAKAENERIFQLCPMDEDARYFSPRRKIIGASLEEIQTTQKLLLAEVKLQSSAMERLAQIRENISAMTQERQLRAGEINDLVGQLHDLVQKGYQIPPATWSRAHQRSWRNWGRTPTISCSRTHKITSSQRR